jgi:hypothetical protein
LPNEFFGAFDVDCAPNASTPPWREPDPVTDFVDTLPDPVDPAEAECLID